MDLSKRPELQHPVCVECGSAQYDQTWDVLEAFLGSFSFEDGSRAELLRDDESNFAQLMVYIHAPNSYREDRLDRFTRHEFVVPVATYDYENWRRWVFDRLISVGNHEICEWFKDAGVRVFPPHHGNGEDPYVVWTNCDLAQERARLAPGEGLPLP